MVLYLVRDVSSHGDVGSTRPADVPEYSAFFSTVDVDGQLWMEKDEGFRVAKFLPPTVRIMTVVSEMADLTPDLAHDFVFSHVALYLEALPGRVSAVDFDLVVDNGLFCERWPG